MKKNTQAHIHAFTLHEAIAYFYSNITRYFRYFPLWNLAIQDVKCTNTRVLVNVVDGIHVCSQVSLSASVDSLLCKSIRPHMWKIEKIVSSILHHRCWLHCYVSTVSQESRYAMCCRIFTCSPVDFIHIHLTHCMLPGFVIAAKMRRHVAHRGSWDKVGLRIIMISVLYDIL